MAPRGRWPQVRCPLGIEIGAVDAGGDRGQRPGRDDRRAPRRRARRDRPSRLAMRDRSCPARLKRRRCARERDRRRDGPPRACSRRRSSCAAAASWRSAAARLLFLSGFRGRRARAGPRRSRCAGWSASRRRSSVGCGRRSRACGPLRDRGSARRPAGRPVVRGGRGRSRGRLPRPRSGRTWSWTARMAKRNLGHAPATGAARDRARARLRRPARTSTRWSRRSAAPTLGRVLWSGSARGGHRRARRRCWACTEGARAARAARRHVPRRLRAIGDARGRRGVVGEVEGVPSRRASAAWCAACSRTAWPSSGGIKIGDIDPRGRRGRSGAASPTRRAPWRRECWRRC